MNPSCNVCEQTKYRARLYGRVVVCAACAVDFVLGNVSAASTWCENFLEGIFS